MNTATAEALLAINRAFYARFARQFALSRSLDQPGLLRLLGYLPARGRLLDVGCGHGRLASLLNRQEWPGTYVGVDSSAELLTIARREAVELAMPAVFVEADVTAAGWQERLPAGPFEAIVALAILHHVPSWQRRRDLLAQLADLLADDGVLALSTWQFHNEDRLRRKIVPWNSVGLAPEQVEPGDALIDWQRGGVGVRYCHLLDEAEVVELAQAAGLHVCEQYYADGRSKNLNLFAVLERRR